MYACKKFGFDILQCKGRLLRKQGAMQSKQSTTLHQTPIAIAIEGQQTEVLWVSFTTSYTGFVYWEQKADEDILLSRSKRCFAEVACMHNEAASTTTNDQHVPWLASLTELTSAITSANLRMLRPTPVIFSASYHFSLCLQQSIRDFRLASACCFSVSCRGESLSSLWSRKDHQCFQRTLMKVLLEDLKHKNTRSCKVSTAFFLFAKAVS